MTKQDSLTQYYLSRGERASNTIGWIFTGVIHTLLLGSLWVFSDSQKTQERPPNHIQVSLSTPKISASLGGKQSTAPTARTAKEPSKPAPKPKPKPKPKEVGLKKKENKPAPKPVKKPEKKQNTPPPPKQTISKPDPAPQKKPAVQSLGGSGGAEDSGIALEVGSDDNRIVKETAFQDYYNTIYATLSRNWARRGLSGGTTVIYFEILDDGSIHNVQITKPSGKPHLDGPAKRAVMASEFPPLPQGYLKDSLSMSVHFRYDKD